MNPVSPFRFAVIADAHFHDIRADYGIAGFSVTDEPLVMRPLAEVARGPRVYNEAGQALEHALQRLVDKDVRDVVLLGDYSDDGQRETLDRLQALLDRFRMSHGMRFHAVPGNHDIFGSAGRHRRKRYLNPDGSVTLVTSDPDFHDPRAAMRIVSPRMHCGGYPANLPAGCGFTGSPGALHWETPFGLDPDPAARLYGLADGRMLMDASYLVEPAEDLWFAMIDANVFAPDAQGDDGLADSTSAGWGALIHHKRFLLDWLADVCRRAGERGKRLIAFSHYPALDPLDATLSAEREMMGPNAFHRRIPPRQAGAALAASGVTLHFSGHVHVNDTAQWRGEDGLHLTNIAVPALVAFPSAYKLVTVEGAQVHVDTETLDDMALDPVLMDAYRRERAAGGADTGAMLEATDYGGFISAHLEHVTGRRFVKREWPPALQPLLRTGNLADLLRLAGVEEGTIPPLAATIPALSFLADWYRLRMGSDLALPWIAPERLALYRSIGPAAAIATPGQQQGRTMALLFGTLMAHLDGLPSTTVTVDLDSGALRAR